MRKKVIFGLLLGAMVVLAVGYVIKSHRRHATSVVLIPVTVAKPLMVTTQPKVKTTAILNAWQQTDITAKNSGYISNIHFEEGQWVKQGDVLITLENSAEQAALSSAEADFNSAKKQYERSQQLAVKGYVSKQELDQARTDFFTAKSTVATAQQNLSNTQLVAPFSGYVGAKTISDGQFVNAGQVLVNLVDTHLIKAIYHLPGQWLPKISLGQEVQVKLINQSKTFTGKVNFIAPNLDIQSNTIEVHSVLDNPNHELTPGQYAEVIQFLGPPETDLYVPENSVQQSLNGMYVFVVEKGMAVQMPVTIGQHHKGMVAILSGLPKNTPIIVQGQYQVKDQTPVKVLP